MSWNAMGSAKSADPRERELKLLYEQHAEALFGYALRLLGGDRHKAEDIVQETLLRCWRKRDLDGSRPARPWLFKVARNLVIDGYRLRMARPQEAGSTWLEGQTVDSDSIDRMLSSMVVNDAVKALTPAHREVLYETYFAGRTTQEVAAILGIPAGTVKSRLWYAIRALRLALREWDVIEGRCPAGPEVRGESEQAKASAA